MYFFDKLMHKLPKNAEKGATYISGANKTTYAPPVFLRWLFVFFAS
ncbi:hypothetical protein SAMN05446037_103433 [Anaerovirgula multivorans]|uniref:Uncharacterized protein n=1 Tax=Anaerovirgula multivorans TaxID=312168 RepID=A0A239JAS0_9FIRM|nr:hypothetical protein SAMN05446037_103433 [Anaerovirgula multivorans]